MGFAKLMSALVVMAMLKGYSFVPTSKPSSIPVPTKPTTQTHIPSDAPTMEDEDDEYSGASAEGSGGFDNKLGQGLQTRINNSTKGGQLRCEQLTIPLCKELGYNFTAVPNILNHTTQYDAAYEMHQYIPLIKVQCSKYLQLFLCSVYAPKCTLSGYLPPCRSICEEAREGCLKLMSRFGFTWPSSLNCSQFHNIRKGPCATRLQGKDDVATPGTPAVQPISIPVCGGNITSVHGTLTSPNYPESYPLETQCTWTITLPKAYHVIQITIDVMRLEEDRNCFYDYIMVRDKIKNQVGPRHCGTYRLPYVISVRGNEASIVFVSDRNGSKKGFSLRYKGLFK